MSEQQQGHEERTEKSLPAVANQLESSSARDATTAVRKRPVLFSGPMVRAILDGTKTQTRRVAKLPADVEIDHYGHPFRCVPFDGGWHREELLCPYGLPGDRLWVREAHAILDMRPEVLEYPDAVAPTKPWPASVTYAADDSEREVAGLAPSDWRESYDADHVITRPSIHMPRWASRLTLELTAVRVERVQDISEEDAKAEGVGPCCERHVHFDGGAYRCEYQHVWDALNAKRGYGWFANPFVWVLEFAAVTR